MTRSRLSLLIALGVDNLGSGLFLPIVLVYVTSDVGIPLGVAGSTITAATVVGLLVPPVAGPLVDRLGPRPIIITAQLAQALGASAYLLARGIGLVILGALPGRVSYMRVPAARRQRGDLRRCRRHRYLQHRQLLRLAAHAR